MSLNLLDWIIIIIYLVGMIVLSMLLARGQKKYARLLSGRLMAAVFCFADHCDNDLWEVDSI